MSLVLHPQNSFTVVRQIANHTDSSTYYVRAVIRNAYTDAIIETLDLVSRGSQRFSKNWQVPADPSGQGFYISIVTSVYTDSGYTSKSENYGDEENTYLIQDRLAQQGRGGGSLGLADIRRIFKEELDKLPKPEKVEMPEIPEAPDHSEELAELKVGLVALGQSLATVPKEQADLAPVQEALSQVMQAIADKEVTPAADLEPVIAKLEAFLSTFGSVITDFQQSLWGMQDELKEAVVSEIKNGLKNATVKASFVMETAPEQEEEEVDVTKLAL
jgi:hypothetical protein